MLGGDDREPLEGPGRLGKGGLGFPPRVQEAIFLGDGEPALAGLHVDDQPLQPVRRGQHLLGVLGEPFGVAQVGD